MANFEKIETRIQREEAQLEALLLRKQELNEQIAKRQKTIENLKAECKVKKLGTLDAIAESKGFSVDELLAAIQSGDLYALQEKLESNQTAETGNYESADAEQVNTESETGYGEET